MNKLTILILLSLVGMGCKSKKIIIEQQRPIGSTISFNPTWRIDTAGNIWMYNTVNHKFYKLKP